MKEKDEHIRDLHVTQNIILQIIYKNKRTSFGTNSLKKKVKEKFQERSNEELDDKYFNLSLQFLQTHELIERRTDIIPPHKYKTSEGKIIEVIGVGL